MDYRIRGGDTLWALSRRFGTSIDALMRANPQIQNRNLIRAGATLNVPGSSDTFEPSPPPPVTGSPPPAAPGGSSRAFEIAMQNLGKNAATLKLESSPVGLAMRDWVGNKVNCANFVSGVLVAAGQIQQRQTSTTVLGLMHHLDQDPDFQRVSLENARPGDVVSLKTPSGHHVVLFAGWGKNGRPQFVGSNNVNPDGTQRISKGGMPYPILAIHHYVG